MCIYYPIVRVLIVISLSAFIFIYFHRAYINILYVLVASLVNKKEKNL